MGRANHMVVTLYSGRRDPDVAKIAAGLATAFARALGAGRVGLVTLTRSGTAEMPLPGVTVRRLPWQQADALSDLVTALRNEHAITVLAVDDRRTDRAFFSFELGERVLLVSDLSVAGLREVQRVLRMSGALGYPSGRVCVVLHLEGEDAPVTAADAAVALKREIYWLLDARKGAGVAASYDGLVRRLLGEMRTPIGDAPPLPPA